MDCESGFHRRGGSSSRHRFFLCSARVGIVGLSAIVSTIPPSNVQAQRRLTVEDQPSCIPCDLVVTKSVTLGRASDSVLLSVRPMVQQNRQSQFLVIGSVPRNRVLVYGTTGALVSTIGRGGQGPGELSDVSTIVLTKEDSLFVIESSGRRVSVFSPDRSWVRTFLVEFTPNDLEVSESSFVLGGIGYSGSALGQPIHLLDPSGRMVKSFGGPTAILQRRPSLGQRLLARSNSGFWSMRPDRYELELWSPSGADRQEEGSCRLPEQKSPQDRRQIRLEASRYRPCPPAIIFELETWQE
jgi:hypothetical protein